MTIMISNVKLRKSKIRKGFRESRFRAPRFNFGVRIRRETCHIEQIAIPIVRLRLTFMSHEHDPENMLSACNMTIVIFETA